jgi:UDP-N-acetylmuramoylalanine--D-glutamate ligase
VTFVPVGALQWSTVTSRPPLPPGPFLLVGLARSGRAAGLILRALGQDVAGCDSGAVAPGARAELEAAGIAVHQQSDGVALLDGMRVVVKSPGVPQEAPVIRAARARGIVVVGELELGWRLLPNPVIAITGSNGKTTTTELVTAMHRAAAIPVAAAGNVGTALTTLAGSLDAGAVVVCEASSFQLEDTLAFAPDAAVLLNLAPDHLDRHGTFDAYRQAKLEIFAHQDAGAVAVLPERLAAEIPTAARRVLFGGDGDVTVADGALAWRGRPVLALEEIRLRGAHNLENAMAASAACLARGMDPEAVAEALRTFAGVEHRLEEVGRFGGVLYVDDSKATNVASAVVGIRSFPAGVHVILGGRGKGEDYAPLVAPVTEHCRAVYLVGEEAGRIGAALTGAAPAHDCDDLEHAVAAARAAARPGEVILLSPACASYDQYRSFGERGEHFKALARAGAG